MSLFIRDDIRVRDLDRKYKKRMRQKASQSAFRLCMQHAHPIGWRTILPYRITKDFEQLYLKGA